jgi:hypothetical protein
MKSAAFDVAVQLASAGRCWVAAHSHFITIPDCNVLDFVFFFPYPKRKAGMF